MKGKTFNCRPLDVSPRKAVGRISNPHNSSLHFRAGSEIGAVAVVRWSLRDFGGVRRDFVMARCSIKLRTATPKLQRLVSGEWSVEVELRFLVELWPLLGTRLETLISLPGVCGGTT